MTTSLLTDITIFVLAILVGFEVISKVPATLHTPLMSAANSIHGIVLAGAMLIAVTANDALGYILAFVACAFAAMQRSRRLRGHRADAEDVPPARTPVQAADTPAAVSGNGQAAASGQPRRPGMSAFDWITQLLYVAAAVCFVLGLHLMNSPASARRGNQVSTAGMTLAIATTLALVVHAGTVTATGWIVMLLGTLVGAAAGLYAGAHRRDDRHAAAGQHVQRGRRRRRGAGRRSTTTCTSPARRRAWPSRSRSSPSWTCSSAP